MTTIRPARATDQRSIRATVRDARLYPVGLSWENFLVAEQDGQLVGVGQVRPHHDSSRELASITVLPPFQRQGIGDSIVQALLARESSPIYLMCAEEMVSFYTRFDFGTISTSETPSSLRWKVQAGTIVAPLASALGLDVGRVAAMKWDGRKDC